MKNDFNVDYADEIRYLINSSDIRENIEAGELNYLLKQITTVSLKKYETENLHFKEILKQIPFGIFFLDNKFRLAKDYSNSCCTIFEKNSLDGFSLIEALGELIPQQLIDNIKDFLNLLFNKDLEVNEVMQLNPIREIEITILNQDAYLKTKKLHFTFHRIFKGNEISQVMVFVFDSYEKSKLENQLQDKTKEYDRQVDLFFKLMSIDPDQFADYINDIELEVDEIQRLLKKPSREISLERKLEELNRSVNYIHEYGKALHVEKIFTSLKKLQDVLSQLDKKDHLQSNDFFSFLFVINEFQKNINEIKSFNQKFLQYKKDYSFEKNSLSKELKQFIEDKTKESCNGLKVNLKLNFHDLNKLDGKNLSIVKYVLNELIQFSFNYSFSMKTRDSYIDIRISSHSVNNMTLTYIDNGSGLDYEDLQAFYENRDNSKKPFLIHFDRIRKKTKSVHPKLVVDSVFGEFIEFNMTFRIV